MPEITQAEADLFKVLKGNTNEDTPGPWIQRAFDSLAIAQGNAALLDQVMAIADANFLEAADAIRGGKADAGREQCAREWAAQQVGYYARIAFNDRVRAAREKLAKP